MNVFKMNEDRVPEKDFSIPMDERDWYPENPYDEEYWEDYL